LSHASRLFSDFPQGQVDGFGEGPGAGVVEVNAVAGVEGRGQPPGVARVGHGGGEVGYRPVPLAA